jgi:SAM-dependent methyltransferase
MPDDHSPGSTPEVWEATADSYDQERRLDPVYQACIARVVRDLRPRGRVLDAGCGTGMQTALIDPACEIHAVDYSQRSLDVLRRRLPNVATRTADLRDLPFQDRYFDAVLCANTLQHLTPDGQRLAARELLRVLRPGGRYAVSVHHYSTEKQRAGWIKEGKPGQADVDYIYRFSRGELQSLFEGCRVRAVGFYGWPMQHVLTGVAGRLLARLGRGHMLIAYGTKPA